MIGHKNTLADSAGTVPSPSTKEYFGWNRWEKNISTNASYEHSSINTLGEKIWCPWDQQSGISLIIIISVKKDDNMNLKEFVTGAVLFKFSICGSNIRKFIKYKLGEILNNGEAYLIKNNFDHIFPNFEFQKGVQMNIFLIQTLPI